MPRISLQVQTSTPQQTPETCRVLDVLIQQRNVERTGSCLKNVKCTKVTCSLQVALPEPNVITEVLTFYPCAVPIHVHFLFETDLQPNKPFIDLNLTESQTFVHKFIGTFTFTVNQCVEGVQVGVS